MALFKNVNGVRIQMTPEEEQAQIDMWAAAEAAEAARDIPQEQLDKMNNLIKALVKEIADATGRTPSQVRDSMKVTLQGF